MVFCCKFQLKKRARDFWCTIQRDKHWTLKIKLALQPEIIFAKPILSPALINFMYLFSINGVQSILIYKWKTNSFHLKFCQYSVDVAFCGLLSAVLGIVQADLLHTQIAGILNMATFQTDHKPSSEYQMSFITKYRYLHLLCFLFPVQIVNGAHKNQLRLKAA